tara:strand:- start:210 stop:326 length:117 start_codon:yes stop_codon:yes gene_type:complete
MSLNKTLKNLEKFILGEKKQKIAGKNTEKKNQTRSFII